MIRTKRSNLFDSLAKKAARTATFFAVGGFLCAATGVFASNIVTNPTDFAVYAGGKVSTGARVTLGGDVAADGSFWVDPDSTVQGDVYTNRGDFSLSGGSTIHGNVITAGNAYLNSNATVTGDIQAAKKGDLAAYATLGGNLVAGKSIYINPNATVGGDVTPNGNPDTFSIAFRDNPGFTYGSTNLGYLAGGQTYNLTAGDYTNLNVGSNATIVLTAGEYNFSRLDWTGSGTQFVADTSMGDIILSFANGASIGSDVTFTNTGGNDFLFQSGGRVSFGARAHLDGSIYVFGSGDLTLGASAFVSGQVYTEGDFFLGNDSIVRGSGSGITTSIPSPTAVSAALLLCIAGVIKRTRRPQAAATSAA